jgi:hypothetical protein
MAEKIDQVAIEFCLFMEMDPYERTPSGKLLYEVYKRQAIKQLAWYAAITKCIAEGVNGRNRN